MKFLLFLGISLFFVSCVNPYFANKNVFNCLPDDNLTNYNSTLLPIETGNKWEYYYEYKDFYLESLSDKEREKLPKKYILEVGQKDFIFAYENKKKRKIVVYRLIQNGIVSNYLYFMKCGEGASIVEINDPENLVLVGSLLIRNSPDGEVHYWDGLTKAKYEWLEPIKEDSPLGSVNLFPLQEKLYNQNIINPSDKKLKPTMLFLESSISWYSPFIGLVKKEIRKEDRVVGYLVLKDYLVERISNPITP